MGLSGITGIKIAATFAKRLQSKLVDSYRLWPHARIDGVEVTQAIQHFRAADHLSDPHDRGIDNSVFLVAGKTAWVRVYVRSGVWESVPGVTGTLHVERRRQRSYDHVRTVSPRPPGHVTAQETIDYATERGDVANTLNFLIQPEEFYGLMRLTVRLTDRAGKESDTLTFEVNTPVRQTLRLRGIFVSYNGPATSAPPGPGQPPPATLPLAAPTLADLQATAGLAMRAMPVQSTGSFTSAGT